MTETLAPPAPPAEQSISSTIGLPATEISQAINQVIRYIELLQATYANISSDYLNCQVLAHFDPEGQRIIEELQANDRALEKFSPLLR